MSSIELLEKIDNNIGEVYSDLGIDKNSVSFNVIDDSDSNEDTDSSSAWVYSRVNNNDLSYEDILEAKKSHNKKLKFHYNTTNEIFFSKLGIKRHIDDRRTLLYDDNEKILEAIEIKHMEGAVIHELRHLYQFKTLILGIDDVEILHDDENKTWRLTPTKSFILAIETDAEKYAYKKRYITLLDDIRFGDIISTLDYYANLNFLNPDPQMKKKIVKYIKIFQNYIDKNY